MKKYKFTTQTPDKVLEFYEKTEDELTEQELQFLMNQFIADFNELPKVLKLQFIHFAMQEVTKTDSHPNGDTSELSQHHSTPEQPDEHPYPLQ